MFFTRSTPKSKAKGSQGASVASDHKNGLDSLNMCTSKCHVCTQHYSEVDKDER